jgi:hypothetical protein
MKFLIEVSQCSVKISEWRLFKLLIINNLNTWERMIITEFHSKKSLVTCVRG